MGRKALIYDCTMLQKFPVNNFEWIKYTPQFNEDFINSHNEENDKGYFIKAGGQYPEQLHDLRNGLLCLPEKMKIQEAEKLETNLHHKSEFVIQLGTLKQVLNHGLVFKKIHRIIKFKEKAWLNTDLKKSKE